MRSRPASGAPRPQSPLRAVALFVIVSMAAPHAQTLQGTLAHNNEPAAAAATEARGSIVQLLVGRSAVISVGQPITRVSLTIPNIADAMVTSPQQLLLHGKAPGTISMFIWDRSGGISRYEVIVQRDLSELAARLKQLFPGENITVASNGTDVVLSGSVSGKYAMDKAAEVAAGYVEKKEDVVNLLKQQEGMASRQVLLRVRFAEVSRTALTELGVSLAANGVNDGRWFGRTTTQQFAAPAWNEDGKFIFSDFLNLFLFDAKNEIAGVVRALQNKGLFQSLAEPNLIAEDGKEASFLAGGEYPYPVVQGTAGGTSIAIQFKEYGVRLNFTPTIVGTDLVKLKVRPEVSSLDFANAVTLEGFRVPAISTRRAETEVELQDGQTFAIAGLMNNTVTSQMSKIPGIGDIPILGLLFRSKAARKDQTELVVMITPTILRRNSTGVSSTVPDMVEPMMPPARKTLPPPPPWNRDSTVPPSTELAPGAAASPMADQPSAPAPVPETQPTAGKEAAAAARKAVNDDAATAVRRAAGAQSPADRKAAEKAAARDREAAKQAARTRAAADAKAREAAKTQARADAERADREKKAAAAQAAIDARKAAADKVQAEKTAREQARLEAELKKRQAEAAQRQAVIDKARAEEIARAEQKLRSAQKEYESALGQKQN
jgi:pilus assembly protein CpaC